MIFVALATLVGGIAARLVYVQTQLTDVYASAWHTVSVTEDAIPCRDGRILSADGQILAHDRVRFDLSVHYRWLQEPPADRWLTHQALARLTRVERRDRPRVEAAKQQVLAERRKLWETLASTIDRSQEQMQAERVAVQQRVERIIEHVNRRRTASTETPSPAPPADTGRQEAAGRSGWQSLRDRLVSELTTPPQRSTSEPVIVTEELAYHVIARDIPFEAVTLIESHPSRYPGVQIETVKERIYPLGSVASHIVGARTTATDEELSAEETRSADRPPQSAFRESRLGRSGIERAWDRTLRGTPGVRQTVRNRHGEVLGTAVVRPPLHGEDVWLSIDVPLQQRAEELLDAALGPAPAIDERRGPGPAPGPQGGALVVLDVRTGEVVVAASAPRHDSNLLVHPTPSAWQTALSDPRRPFFPRVTQMAVAPGSVFKLVTSAALLESGRIDPETAVACQGYLDRPDRNRCYVFRHYGVGHGDVALTDALCQSCNVYFFQAGRELGPAVLSDWAMRFGLGVPTGSEMPGERGGHVPQADSRGQITGETWYPGSTLQLAIGQSSLSATPLQVARMVAAIANGGYLVTPQFTRAQPHPLPDESRAAIQLVSAEEAVPGPNVDELTPTVPTAFAGWEPPAAEPISGLSSGTLARIRAGMELVVNSRRGTGRRAAVTGIALAGKTGTAEVSGGADHAWFVGFVPADQPMFAVVVLLEHGGAGGATAAPLAGAFVESLVEHGLIERTPGSASPSE